MNAINTAMLYEKYRLKRLRRLRILDTAPEERFDRLTRIVRDTFDAPIALISLIDEHRQWFKSRQGVELDATCREHAFCAHAIRQDDVFVVEDASNDPRFSSNPMVVGEPCIRFYAGAPVREPGGLKVGTLCIIDTKPRSLKSQDIEFLRDLAYLVEHELEADTGRVEGLLDQAELKRSVRTCQRQMARRVSDDEKLSTILGQLVSLTRSSGGFIVDTSEVGTKGQVTVLARQLPPRGSDDYGFWERVGRRRIPVGELSALLDEERFSEMFSFPIHRDGALTGMIVLEGRSDGYPQALFHELSPLIQPALSVLESMALRVERFALQAETDPDSAPASAANSQDRRVLNRLVAREIQAAGLRGGSVSVCWLDLDDFAKFNQSHGEEAGDRVLCQIASRLRQSVRKEDIVAAAGGDEFVIVFKDTDAPAFYQRVMDAFGQPVDGVKGNARISASMGVSVYPDDPSDSETLLRHAEQALYQAKEEGRGRHRVFDFKKFRVIEERSAFLREIERALDNREFELFLQPKINLEERTVEGFEGLIRWNHPERGRLTPDQFLPLIEATPLEEQLGNYVLHAGMELLNLFQKQGGGYGLSVNLSPAHFLGERFLQDMDALLSRYPTVLRGRLTLEILETTAWGDQDAAARVVRQCKQLGVSMALDDFGTGFSSLSYFRKLPLDEIKIDKSFVMDMEQQPEDEVIVESIIALSKRFGRRVVAEGIESEAVAKKLAELGCDVAQGYFFSRPLPVSEALSFASSFECSVHTKVTC